MIITLILIAINSFLIVKMCLCDRVHLLLKILLCISFFAWYATPYIITLLPEYENLILCGSRSLYDFCNITNQVFLTGVYSLAFYLINKKDSVKLVQKIDFQENIFFIRTMTNICIALVIISIFSKFYSSGSYSEFDLTSSSRDSTTGFMSFFYSFARFFLITIICFYKNLFNRTKIWEMRIPLYLYYFITALGGSRICLFAIIMLILYESLSTRNTKNFIISLCLCLGVISILPAMSALRHEVGGMTVKNITNNATSSTTEIYTDLAVKLNSVDYSTFLLLNDGIGGAGPKVYTSALYALIPRFIYPQKPELGSKDGTIMGCYARFAANEISGNADDSGFNVGTCTSIISLWTLGWPMFFVQMILCGIILYWFNSIFIAKKVFFTVAVLAMVNYPACLMEVSLDVFLANIQRYFVIYLIFSRIFKVPGNNYIPKSQE